MLFVYISDIQQITEQSFYLSAADNIRLCYVLETAAVTAGHKPAPFCAVSPRKSTVQSEFYYRFTTEYRAAV